jgi:xanthine dehydrogenase large subunit
MNESTQRSMWRASAMPQGSPTEIVGQPLPHDSATLHVSGRARYADDQPLPANTLHAAIGVSPIAHGRIRALDLDAVRQAAGVIGVITAEDIPGENQCGPIKPDDPILAPGLVQFVGQPVFAVAATSHEAARRAARRARIDCEPLPAIFDVRSAIAAGSFVVPSVTMRRGQPEQALAGSQHRLRGTLEMGGQDHFYLESQIAVALPQEDGAMRVISSTQHPTEVQNLVARALGLAAHQVTVECRRMGGGFGGKESQPALLACIAAVFARRTGRPVKLRLDRDDDMTITGKRHEFLADYEVGFDDEGRITGLKVMMAARCGFSADLSGPVSDRALCQLDNAYFLEHVEIVSHRCRTNTVSNTAFRGFGGPQGTMIIESVLDDIARSLSLDPLEVRQRNLYGIGERDITPYGMRVEDNLLPTILERIRASSDYAARRARITARNAEGGTIRHGLALTPVKFGISFNALLYNQAGALVHVYADGSVLVNHGGTEMGQGLHIKIMQVVAQTLGLPIERVRVSATDTSKVPNTSATAASSGADLNGKAAQQAALAVRERLIAFAAERHGVATDSIRIADGIVHIGEDRQLPFPELTKAAYTARVSLSANGFYRTPKIHWDPTTYTGRPYFYFAYGAAVCEVAIDTLTGEYRILRLDVLHDVGQSLNPAIDIGQIEGAISQGIGWLTSEKLFWNEQGRLMTHAPSTYKIPTARDWPADARIELLAEHPNREDSIYRSKAVGEPPLMLAIVAYQALRDAVASCGPGGRPVVLEAPATPEAVLAAVLRESGQT